MAAVAGLGSLGGVILSGLIGAAITAAGTTGVSAVTVTRVSWAILSVMGAPATEAVPLMTVTVYPGAVGFFTNLVSPQSARWQV